MLQESIEVRRGTWIIIIILIDAAVKRPLLFLIKSPTADPAYDSQTTRVCPASSPLHVKERTAAPAYDSLTTRAVCLNPLIDPCSTNLELIFHR